MSEYSRKFSKKLLLPPLMGILTVAIILGLLNFQYLSSRFTYALSSGDNSVAVLDIEKEKTVSKQSPPRIYIPNIKADAPIQFQPDFTSEDDVQLLLREGVVHYYGTANPGEQGNAVIIGHSSGAAWRPGKYKFVFTLLEKMKTGDKILIDYNGTRYIYTVIGNKIVEPTQVDVLDPTDDYRLTLITCWPVGTNTQRTVVTAIQTSPDPNYAQDLLNSTITPINLKDVLSPNRVNKRIPSLLKFSDN